MVYPYDKALDQAIRLTDTALKNVLLDDGEFDRERFAEHLHSTSSMISGIAMLGSLIQNQEILCRVKKFMENGYYQVATDFGWCLEITQVITWKHVCAWAKQVMKSITIELIR